MYRLRKRGRSLTYGTAALLAVAGLTATAPVTLATPAAAASPSHLAGATAHVTLITGDTVGVDPSGRVVGVDPGEGRARIPLSVQRLGSHTYVVPADAAALLGSGRLDRRLFDVTRMVADGYDDAHRTTLPLIVSYKGSATGGAKRALRAADAEVERQLPAVRGESVTADKPHATEVWEALTRPVGDSVTTEAGIDRVWLDAAVKAPPQRYADVDPDPTQGTAQIHAPAAWRAGYDGTGVKVAVLDSGIDATHPDLRGAVVASKDFSGSGGVDDQMGHGTHVASTIAGTGAASNGRYKGVAPGARLLVGRVFGNSGGQESWLIGAMQWAAGQGAKVVNMSLGAVDAEGTDPLEQAVNDLSASSGALFVIAAGNDGPDAGTLNSPGAAAAALTVAAVDGTDRLADFSSRGPTADGELKPDIAAPGVDIIAAKAVHGTEGEPAGTAGYVRMSGTSMATPHVVGAAAVLAQEHPDWSGQRIKAVLMGSTVPVVGTSSTFEQGAGRVDVARAIGQSVFTDEPSLSFGLQAWPHTDDRSIARTLTYRNTGDKAVTLDLSASATGPDGKAAAHGMFTVSPARLTVPAGGTAEATVTADTRVGTVDGAFSGIVAATAATAATGESVRTAFAVVREVESYDLKLEFTGRDGKPAAPLFAYVVGLDNGRQWTFGIRGSDVPDDGKVTIRVPRGRYLVDAKLTRSTDSFEEVTQLVAPGLVVDRNMTLPLDARTGKAISVTAPDAQARLEEGRIVFGARGAKPAFDYAGTLGLNGAYGRVYLAQVGPSAPAKDFIAQLGGVWQRGSTGPLYDLVETRTGSFFTGLNRAFSSRGLAKVVTGIGSNAKDSQAAPSAGWTTPGWPAVSSLVGSNFGNWRPVPAASVVHYASTDHGLRWNLGVNVINNLNPGLAVLSPLEPRRFEPGRTYQETFNTGVFAPVTTGATAVGVPGASHSGTAFAVCVPLLSDGAGHMNSGNADWRFRLASGSTTIADKRMDPCVLGPMGGLLPHRATYRLSLDAARPARDVTVGHQVSAVWTFAVDAASGTGIQRLPLSVVRFTPKLSLTSTAKAGAGLTVPIGIQGPAAAKGAVKSLAVQVSYDAGRTWRNTVVHADRTGKRFLTLAHPAGPGTVSLKATLVDTKGNTVTETLPNAYRTVR
ncbi:S8 family serine peptidase [Streptomyces sp. NBC_01485]|uniref:S8 family serine peptidase n=1 Tax=Streptomyces sp. NBC_01485 TaxID=2903884 RepID=UPI002E36BFC0|nr:S8 family serine peptidase [Streptomyces sp. NBC_01485]